MAHEVQLEVPPGRQEVEITRIFEAPPAALFRAHTDRDLIPRWWGPRRLTTTVLSLEARPGGLWHYVQRGEDGQEHDFHGYFHLVEEPRRLIATFEYAGAPGHVLLNEFRFEDLGGRTRLHQKAVYLTVDERDAMVAAGMEEGLREGVARLDELLAGLSAPR